VSTNLGAIHLDTLLEPTKEKILEEVKFQQIEMDATELEEAPLKTSSKTRKGRSAPPVMFTSTAKRSTTKPTPFANRI